MNIRLTEHQKADTWYIADDGQFKRVTDICTKEPNGDYLIEVAGELLLLKMVQTAYGVGYQVKIASPDKGLRNIGTMDFFELAAYVKDKGIDVSIFDAPAQVSAPKAEEKPAPAPAMEKPEEKPAPVPVMVKTKEKPKPSQAATIELFPEIEQFLKTTAKRAS